MSYSESDSNIYSLLSDSNTLINYLELYSMCLEKNIYIVSFKLTPSIEIIHNISYEKLNANELFKNNLIDYAVSCDFAEHEMVLYISKGKNDMINAAKKLINDFKKFLL